MYEYDEDYEPCGFFEDFELDACPIENTVSARLTFFNHHGSVVRVPEREGSVSGFVYALFDGRFVKIGATKNIRQRINELQSGNPRKLLITGICETEDMYAVESAFHNKYKKFNVMNEWFDMFSALGISRKDACEYIAKSENLHKRFMSSSKYCEVIDNG